MGSPKIMTCSRYNLVVAAPPTSGGGGRGWYQGQDPLCNYCSPRLQRGARLQREAQSSAGNLFLPSQQRLQTFTFFCRSRRKELPRRQSESITCPSGHASLQSGSQRCCFSPLLLLRLQDPRSLHNPWPEEGHCPQTRLPSTGADRKLRLLLALPGYRSNQPANRLNPLGTHVLAGRPMGRGRRARQ